MLSIKILHCLTNLLLAPQGLSGAVPSELIKCKEGYIINDDSTDSKALVSSSARSSWVRDSVRRRCINPAHMQLTLTQKLRMRRPMLQLGNFTTGAVTKVDIRKCHRLFPRISEF